jgi:hypothetical protein
VLIACGRPELIIYAVFGAFTGMYGRAERHQLRLRHQAQAACMLVLAVAVGVTFSALHLGSWALVAVECTLAGVGSLFADRAGLRPPGPFFGLFALGACSAVPLSTEPWAAVAIAASSASFSIVVGFAGWIRGRQWTTGARREPAPPSSDWVARALAYSIAVGAAGSVSMLLGIGHPYWAMASAAVPLAAAGASSGVLRAIHRVLGTLVGLALTACIVALVPTGAIVVVALLVIALQFPTELFMTRNYALALVFFTPLIILMTQLARPGDPWTLVADRAIETVLGAAIGVIVVIAMRPRSAQA